MNEKLPKLTIHPALKRQRERFIRWLAEWEIDRALRIADMDDRETGCPNEKNACFVHFNAIKTFPVEVGHVRLMSPEFPATRDRLLYLCILEQVDPDLFLAAPYGRFSEPCLPGELATGRKSPCLRVLCLWNAREMPRRILNKSWFVDRLSGRETDEALTVLRHIEKHAHMPERLKKKLGPPLWHPADPRIRYRTEEDRFMRDVQTGLDVPYIPSHDMKRGLPFAAEPRSSYTTGSNGGGKKNRSNGNTDRP